MARKRAGSKKKSIRKKATRKKASRSSGGGKVKKVLQSSAAGALEGAAEEIRPGSSTRGETK